MLVVVVYVIHGFISYQLSESHVQSVFAAIAAIPPSPVPSLIDITIFITEIKTIDDNDDVYPAPPLFPLNSQLSDSKINPLLSRNRSFVRSFVTLARSERNVIRTWDGVGRDLVGRYGICPGPDRWKWGKNALKKLGKCDEKNGVDGNGG